MMKFVSILVEGQTEETFVQNDFPRYQETTSGNPYRRVEFLEQAFLEDVNHSKFLPYFALHEFESLLFVEPQAVATSFADPAIVEALDHIRRQYASPEEINDGQATHPAARIKSIIPTYSKRLHGPLFVEQIGIAAIRTACPHFNQWLTRLESLAS